MRILFINLPYYGHVVPTPGLVRELIRQAPGNQGGATAIIQHFRSERNMGLLQNAFVIATPVLRLVWQSVIPALK